MAALSSAADAEGAVAGVVSQRDLFHGALAWSLGQGSEAHRKALEACPVKQVMQCDVRQTTPDTPLAEAAREMLAAKIGCLPVVERERLVGILTESDLLALIVPA